VTDAVVSPFVRELAAFLDVVNGFCDVGGMVAHSFDVRGAEQKVDAETDVARVFHHVGQELAEQRIVDRVDFLVATPDGERLFDVAAHICVKHILDLEQCQIGHVIDATHHLSQLNILIERAHPLGDVLGEIPDALQVVGDAQGADDVAQIDGHRLPARNGQNPLFLDLALEHVDLLVERYDALRELKIVAVERVDRIADLLFGEAAHFGDDSSEFLKINVECAGRVFHQLVLVSLRNRQRSPVRDMGLTRTFP
jgi:hypothetical protein